MKKLCGWGRYPQIEANVVSFDKYLKNSLEEGSQNLISRGNGRSYGDSSLASNVLNHMSNDRFLSFDKKSGELEIESGVLISQIIKHFAPLGWFPYIVAGTKLISVGGAIASDIHGKNHHKEGCFSECVTEIKLLSPNKELITCSREANANIFHATCGGMGLTGPIVSAKIKLKKINSTFIEQKIIKTKNLEETFKVFEEIKDYRYSVAWLDCLNQKRLGRAVINCGDFSNDGNFSFYEKRVIKVPLEMPAFILNPFNIKQFNKLYYFMAKEGQSKIYFDKFFFPLDSILDWNLIYGKNGFMQYQFIIPKDNSLEGISEILKNIASSNFKSFLSVLKLYGPQNNNFLSFPIEGYSLAIDFKIEDGLIEFINSLNKIILKSEGRIYLAKDVCMTKEVFDRGYPRSQEFRNIRKKYGFDEHYNSLQSLRLGL